MDKIYKVPETPWVKGFRPLVKKDRKIVYELLNNYMKKFKVWMHFDMNEFKHFVKTTLNVIYPYVVQQENGEITDFISFYLVSSSILKNEKHKKLNVN